MFKPKEPAKVPMRIAVIWSRFTRKVLRNEKMRSMKAQFRFRKLAKDLLLMNKNRNLFLETRFARLINKYTRFK